MGLSSAIKILRQKSLLTQEEFASKLEVALSTVNRWEKGKARPNLSAMKNIKAFCEEYNLPYSDIESAWIEYPSKEDDQQ